MKDTMEKTKLIPGKYGQAYDLLLQNPEGITIRDIVPFANSPHEVISTLINFYGIKIETKKIKAINDQGRKIWFKRYFLSN